MRPRGETGDFAHSLTDLMAGVAAIFLLIAVVFILMAAKREKQAAQERTQYKDQLDLLEAFRKDVLDKLDKLRDQITADESLAGFVTVDEEARKRDPFLLLVVFNRQLFSFKSGVCALNLSQVETVRNAAPKVLEHVCAIAKLTDQSKADGTDQRRALISMTLEGHTDGDSFLPRAPGCGVDTITCTPEDKSDRCNRIGFENNVRLSAARAQNVFFAMQDAVKGDAELSSCLERYFVVAGRGPVEPADGSPVWQSQRSKVETERNRRVVLKIRAQASLGRGSTAPTASAPP